MCLSRWSSAWLRFYCTFIAVYQVHFLRSLCVQIWVKKVPEHAVLSIGLICPVAWMGCAGFDRCVAGSNRWGDGHHMSGSHTRPVSETTEDETAAPWQDLHFIHYFLFFFFTLSWLWVLHYTSIVFPMRVSITVLKVNTTWIDPSFSVYLDFMKRKKILGHYIIGKAQSSIIIFKVEKLYLLSYVFLEIACCDTVNYVLHTRDTIVLLVEGCNLGSDKCLNMKNNCYL